MNHIANMETFENPTIKLGWTCAEVFIDKALDLIQLAEVRGLQQRKQVPYAELFPGHDGMEGLVAGVSETIKGEGKDSQTSLSQCPVSCPAWRGPRAARRYSLQAPLQETFEDLHHFSCLEVSVLIKYS